MIRAPLAGFANPLRKAFRDGPPPIPKQTAAEMLAYCRVNGIPVDGPALAKVEYRTGPHPQCAYAHLPTTRRPTVHLFGQRDWTRAGDDA